MGFFYSQAKRSPTTRAPRIAISAETMAAQGCRACPRNLMAEELKPVPEGRSSGVDVYLLGPAPTDADTSKGRPYAARLWRMVQDPLASARLRWRGTNIVRCPSPKPLKSAREQEVLCCRGFAEADIAECKPKVVLGFGGEALEWATGLTNIMKWRGWSIPTVIGGHPCWYYPLAHPEYVEAKGDEYQLVFDHDLKQALEFAARKTPPPVPQFTKEDWSRGIECITGEEGKRDIERLETHLHKLLKEPTVGFDIETQGLRPYSNSSRIWTASFGTYTSTVAFPLSHPEGWTESWQPKVWGIFRDFLMESGRKICHNLSFEQEWMGKFFGTEVLRRTEWEDTMAQAHSLDERPGTHSLGVLTRAWFGFNLKDAFNVDPVRLLEYPIVDALRYNGGDAKWTHLLYYAQRVKLQDEELGWEYERKVRLSPTLVGSQLKGVMPDIDRAEKLKEGFEATVERVERLLKKTPEVDAYTRLFGAFSPTSDQHVLKLFRDVLKRKEVDRGDGSFSTDESVLSKIPREEALSAHLILEHRAASKVLSTYLLPIVNREIVHDDGLIHTNYNSMVAETGRLSSDDPNLQNYPTRKNKEVRSIVVAFTDHLLVAVDYGQIEARVIAMASECPNLVRYLWEGYDIHGAWAKRIRGAFPAVDDWLIEEFQLKDPDDAKLQKQLRQETKNKWVFPQFFGSSFRSCARTMHLPEQVAQGLAEEFWDEFRAVRKWQDRTVASYKRKLYVETLTGRRRHGPLSLNQIINTPIQGTASDIVTESMNALSVYAEVEDKPQFQAVMNIHDDLTFYIPDETVDTDIQTIAHEMTKIRFPFINVPLIVEVSMGRRWNEKDEVGVWSSEDEHNHKPSTLRAKAPRK